MRYAIIENAVCTNIVEADEAFARQQGWIPAGNAAIGDLWDGEKFTKPLPDLDALRTAKNDEINAERERRTFATFEHAGKAISCDTLSRSDIDGINGYVALYGAFPDIWPGEWKCADNTYLAIGTVGEWKAFYGAMVSAGSALYSHAQELKAQLAQATTAEEIAEIRQREMAEAAGEQAPPARTRRERGGMNVE